VSANLELVEAITGPWGKGDYGSADWAHPDIEYVYVDWAGPPGTGIRLGDDWRIAGATLIQLDDERVLALGSTSAAIFHVSDGRVAKLVIYWDHERAVADVGLPPGTEAATLPYAEGAFAYAQRGVEGLAETFDDDVVYEEDPLWPGAATYHGKDAVVARFREYEEQLGRTTVRIERIAVLAEGAVVIFVNAGVTPSGLPFEHRWAWLGEMRDGKAVRIRAYFDPDEALRAADPGAQDS
jgi:ketosteroid isomerase-like protein